MTGRPKFLQDPPCFPTLGGALGTKIVINNIGVRMSDQGGIYLCPSSELINAVGSVQILTHSLVISK